MAETIKENLGKIAIYIPAYNAAVTLPKVLDRIPENIKESVAEIFVVDNASQDGTSIMALGYRALKGMHQLKILRNKENRGYGGSQKLAYQYCIEKGYKAVVMLHGDAQYAPEKMESLLEPVLTGKADMVFGSRIAGDPLKGGMPLHRFLGNRFLTTIQNMILGTKLTEFHSGYRVFSVEALKKVPFTNLSDDFHFDTEIIVLFVDRLLRIIERPIPTYYGDEPNFVNIWSYGMRVLETTFKYGFHRKGIIKIPMFDSSKKLEMKNISDIYVEM